MSLRTSRLAESAPKASIEKLARELVSIPSRAGIDSAESVLQRMAAWLDEHGLEPTFLTDQQGNKIALVSKYTAPTSGPSLCFNACLDTAPFGDEHAWSFSPTDGTIVGSKLRGRGSADSKIGASIIAHVVDFLANRQLMDRGTIYLLFDSDEHTGRFGGVRSFVERVSPAPHGVVLGYPGNEKLVVGARGFYRVRISVFGKAAHSGATTRRGVNAIEKLAEMISAIRSAQLPHATDEFPLPPAATVSEVCGGGGFSQIPDKATCNIDIRTTPSFDGAKAHAWLEDLVARLDTVMPSPANSIIELDQTWPPYVVDANSRLVASFLAAGRDAFDRPIAAEICGPSNIGNYLSTRGIPAICGLGVGYENIHGADENSDVTSIPASFSSYVTGALNFFSSE
jgi:succinyl-diaminopimelate desuccinylase